MEILEEADLIIEGLERLVGNFAEILSNLKDFRDLRTRSLLDLNLLSMLYPFSEFRCIANYTFMLIIFEQNWQNNKIIIEKCKKNKEDINIKKITLFFLW